jgi:hypothetical protein
VGFCFLRFAALRQKKGGGIFAASPLKNDFNVKFYLMQIE